MAVEDSATPMAMDELPLDFKLELAQKVRANQTFFITF